MECFTCKYFHRPRALCIKCNTSYETHKMSHDAQWERVGWEPSEEYLEVLEQDRIVNKGW